MADDHRRARRLALTLLDAGRSAEALAAADKAVQLACREAAKGEVVEPVNFNAPSQIVIAGPRDAKSTRALLREVRQSFYRKLFLAYVAGAVVPGFGNM